MSILFPDVQNCIKDGILMLKDGPYNLYIPDLAQDLVEKYLGPSSLYGHLVQSSTSSTVPAVLSDSDNGDVLRRIILQHLDVDPLPQIRTLLSANSMLVCS